MNSVAASKRPQAQDSLRELASRHSCSSHKLFSVLNQAKLSLPQAAAFLKNYDAHATVLRRLLLNAATLMPEPAVGFVLENVRNEYGNGNYANNHQYQLRSVASQAGVDEIMWEQAKIDEGVQQFVQAVPAYYNPPASSCEIARAAVSAGAITATELLAIQEFKAMQIAFGKFGLSNHVWFDHVLIEEEHSDESLMLALYFAESHDALAAVEFGMNGVLGANIHLYDGLLGSIEKA